MFHVRRRPADSQPRRRKKKSGSLRVSGSGGGSSCVGVLTETLPDGSPAENAVSVRLGTDVLEVGSANGAALQLYGPSIQPRHCVLATTEGLVTVTPRHADAEIYIDGERIYQTTFLQHGSLLKFGRISTFRFMDPVQENNLSRNLSQSQHFDSGSVYDRSPTSPIPDNLSKTMSPSMHSQLDGMQSSMDPSGINSTAGTDFQRALSPSLGNSKMGSQDNFGMSYNKNQIDNVDSISGYNNNNNNNTKMDGESLILSQHLANSKADLLQENHFASPYNGIGSPQNAGSNKEQQNSIGKNSGSQYKDNYETTFDLDGNVETKSICSAKSGGSGHDNRLSRGQEAILPAVLEFPEHCQQMFLQSVITGLDVNAPAFKLAPVYTLYLCARYRASTHYRPELTPTERAHKLTALLHHIATLIQNTVQEKYSDASVQAFWMANSSELLHFLKCDRHISAFSIQAQDILAHTVQTAFSNLVGCFHVELSQVLPQLLDEQQSSEAAASLVLGSLGTAMALLRKCRVNAALTIQLFSQLFHYINVWCFNKVVTSPHMWCGVWGALVSVRLAPIGTWAERQGLELPADCHLALIHQCAHLLQAPKNTHEDIANLTSTCFKLNSVQLRCLLGGFTEDPSGSGGPGSERLQPELVEAAVKHAQVVADELHRADGREITLEESSTLPLSLMIPEDGFSADVVRGLPSGLAEFLSPLQRAALCRLAPQPHSQGHWTVYMNGYHGGGMTVRPPQQPVVQVIQLQKNSNGMGLSIVAAKGAGQTRLGIYIKSVVAGGAAAADQRLMAGDQLLSVDGHSLVGITQERAAEYLVRTGPLVTLEVAKQGAVLHGLATLLRQPSPQADRGTFHKNSMRNLRQKNLMLLKEDSLKSSSDDSINNPICNIPRVIINCDGDEFERYDEDGSSDSRTQKKSSRENVTVIQPTFSFTDFDEICQSEMRTACQHLQKFEESGKIHTCHREQSVDSSNQSCDSDCSYPGCTEKNDTTSHYSYGEEPTLELAGKIDFDLSKQQSVYNKSFQIIDESCDSSVDRFNSIEICRLDDCDEIPYIDDIDSEPLIFEHKSCSKEDICQDTDHEPTRRILFSDPVAPYQPPVKKKSCDVGINVQLDSLTLEDERVNNVNKTPLVKRETVAQIEAQADKQSFVRSDFLGQSPKDQNFFSESLLNSKNSDSFSSVHYISIDRNDSRENLECNNNFLNSKNEPVITEYNVLESSDDSPDEINNENSNSFEKLKKHKSDFSPRSHSRNGVNFYSTYTDSESSSSEFINKSCNLMVIGKSISKSSDLIDDKTENRCWNSPDDIRLGNGKVKALTKHFNSINLVYQSKSLKRNCQSSPNLFQNIKNEKSVLGPVISSASLANISKNFPKASSQNSADPYSEQEKENILIQLEDWSKFGTRGSVDSLTIITDNLVNKMKCAASDNGSKASIVFQEIVQPKPRMIILEEIEIDSRNKNKTSNDALCKDNFDCHLEKKFGSLEKLTGSTVPRVIEMIPRKTLSTPNVCKEIVLRKPAIEKTKLVLPKKKFPHSYIVRKKSTSVDTHDSVTDSDLHTRNIMQSCPNLLKNSQIKRNHNLVGGNFHHSCPSLIRNSSASLSNIIGPSFIKTCRFEHPRNELRDRPPAPRYTSVQSKPMKVAGKMNQSYGDISLRRMSERDLPSKLEQEQSSAGGHIPSNTVKSSKSVPALHEHTKQHEVFNPGYSRTSSNNSIPAMPGLKGKPPHHQADQNSFYQNLSVYRNTGLGDRSSALRNSQNALQLQGQSQQMKANTIAEGQGPQSQSGSDRLSLSSANQRPQSAYYGNQPAHSPGQGTNGMRTAQSTKDLAYGSESQANHQVRGGYPSMPNVNQGYSTHNPNQPYSQMQGAYSTNQLQSNTYNRPPMSPMNPNQYNNQAVGNGPYGNQTQFGNQGQASNQYHNQNQYSNQQQIAGGNLNQYNSHLAGSSPNLRGQAKLAEMSEEVTRRQQRGPLNTHGDPNLMSPMQQNRFQYGSDAYNNNNGPMSPNTPMTANKPQPPVAPKPQGMKRGVSGEMISQDIVEGPPLPPTATHPLYHHSNANDEDGNYLAGSEPSAAGYYGTQRGGQGQQTSGQTLPPNPWEREEREKELEARRLAARVWRDKQISALQGIGEDRRTPQQEQQLRALTLERDFQKRAQQAQTEDDDKETERPPAVPPHGGLLRVATNNGNNNSNGQAPQGINPGQDLNLVPVASNIVSSIQPICVATSNTNGSEQTQDSSQQQQQNENRNSNQLPPPPPPVQPKSILKSNLRLDNLNSNSPQSPSKSQKNASFSANLTPQSLKFDSNPKMDQKYDVNNSKYDHNVNNKYDVNAPSKYDSSQPKYPEQMNPISGKYEQHLSYNINNTLGNQNLAKYDPNLSNNAVLSPNTLSQNLSNMNINANLSYSRLDNAVDSNVRHSYDSQMYNQQNSAYIAAPPPPERGSSFAIMSQQQALRSNVSTSSQMSLVNQNSNQLTNQALNMKDKRVSFHDNDPQNMSVAGAVIDSRELDMEPMREDPNRFITEAEMMLQSPTTPPGTNVTHTPGVIGAQEVYRDPRQRRLAEQQKAQEAGNTPIPEKLSFKEKMKMFALESGESNTPKDKVKISRAQRDIDAVH